MTPSYWKRRGNQPIDAEKPALTFSGSKVHRTQGYGTSERKLTRCGRPYIELVADETEVTCAQCIAASAPPPTLIIQV